MKVIDYIERYVENAKYKEPLFSDDIYRYVKSNCIDLDRALFNTYLARYEKQVDGFVRYQKGIYYKTKSTPFGDMPINYADIIYKIYLRDGDNVIGYESGPSFFNKLGLTTQIPQKTYIVTNNKRRKIKDIDNDFVLLEPIEKINKDNYRYYQLLDVLNNKFKIQIEADDYFIRLENFIKEYDLSYQKLLAYAKAYNNIKVYDILATLAKESLLN